VAPAFVSFDSIGFCKNGFSINSLEHFSEIIYPNGDRGIKVNSISRPDLVERINEINLNVDLAWERWVTFRGNRSDYRISYKYHSCVDVILFQMRRIVDDIFSNIFYKIFKNEVLELGFYDIDSFQWLYSDHPFKRWPFQEIGGLSLERKKDLKSKLNKVKNIFIGNNDLFLKTMADANNSSKHSYLNSSARGKLGLAFPSVVVNKKSKAFKGGLDELNAGLNQMIFGFTDFLYDLSFRLTKLRDGELDVGCGSYRCDAHVVNKYVLDLPRVT
jgi:hypothetical protein